MKNEPRHLHTKYEPLNFSSRAEWTTYARRLEQHIKTSLCLLPEPQRTPLKAKVFGTWQGNGYTCEKVHFESIPGFYVTGNLFRPPAGSRQKRPGILCPHGHWEDGRIHDRDRAGSVIARCIQLARMGTIVFSYDMTGYTDSCQLEHQGVPSDPHWGMSLMAIQTWNSIRALDFLFTLPEINKQRIGVTGASGGGTQTFALTAVDDRVSAAAPICMVSYHMQGGCICENAPLLRIDATNVDIARLAAPRPMFMGSCTQDWTKNTLTEELPAIRAIYKFYGAQNVLKNHHIDFEHSYNLEMCEHVYGFFNRFLLDAASNRPVKEQYVERPPHRDRMVWWGRQAPAKIPYGQFREMWRDRQRAILRPLLKDANTAREALGTLLPHVVGMSRQSVSQFAATPPTSVRVSVEGRQCTIIPQRYGRDDVDGISYYNTYNRTSFADRVHEILGVLEECRPGVHLHGIRSAGPATLVAAALSTKVKSVTADMCNFDPDKDSSWRKHFDTPAIRQIGGLATVFASTGTRQTELVNATDSVRQAAHKYGK